MDKQESALTNITNTHLDNFVANTEEESVAVVTTPDPEKKRKRIISRDDDEENMGKMNDFVEIKSPVFKRSRRKSKVDDVKPASNDDQKSQNLETPLENNFDDDDDIFACLNDSDFETSPVKKKKENVTDQENLTIAQKIGRHRVINVVEEPGSLVLTVKEEHAGRCHSRTLTLKDSWLNSVVNVEDIINVDVDWSEDNTGVVDDARGLVVINPDTLVSGTAVVSALFCMRKAFLSEKFKGQEGGNRVMLIGTAVHELLQEVLRLQAYSREEIINVLNSIMTHPKMISDIFALNLSEADIRKEVADFIVHIQFFVRRFIKGELVAKPEAPDEVKGSKSVQKDQWRGKIVEVCDIEENFWSPRLGIKGKIDLTVRTVNGRQGETSVQPLELKTGKATHSSSHKGQVMLYCMMSGDRRVQAESGLLLYLRSSDMTQVQTGHHEQRGLIQLRNELVAWIRNPGGELPEPISHKSACSSCGLLDVCASYQKIQNNVPRSPSHPMGQLVSQTLHHLSDAHIAWFGQWSSLLDLESQDSSRSGGELSDLWCVSPGERESRGQAVSGLVLESVSGLEHRFTRSGHNTGVSALTVGEVVVVSTDSLLALSQGVIRSTDLNSLVVSLDRDLSSHSSGADVRFHVDRFVYQSAQSSCYVGLAKMISDTPAAARLREACIDFVKPTFVPGLGREVAEHGKAVLRTLNRVQQRAVLKSIMCERFSLIRGMPGTGKTTTIVGLVRLLARMGQSVLLVSYTNSAVDTILTKLLHTGQPFLRLGRKDRVRRELWPHCAELVSQDCGSVSSLAKLYNSFTVVASTCLAVNHPATANRQFDWCICDEASQALLPSVISSLLLANKFILVGDHAQLPPTVQSSRAKQGGLDQSLFSILDSKHPEATSSLTLQYRMNQQIARMANHLTYEDKLECGTDEVRNRVITMTTDTSTMPAWIQRCVDTSLDQSVLFVDTESHAREEKQVSGICNKIEADMVQQLVTTLLSSNVKQDEVGVIAPYSAQVKHIKVCQKKHISLIIINY